MWKYLRSNWYVFRDCPDSVLQWIHEAYLEMDIYDTSEVVMFVEEGEAEYRLRKSKRTKSIQSTERKYDPYLR